MKYSPNQKTEYGTIEIYEMRYRPLGNEEIV